MEQFEIFCSLCGFKNTQNTFFCDNCGQQFNFDINASAPPDYEIISQGFEEEKYMDFSTPPLILEQQNHIMQPVTLNIIGMSDSLPISNYSIIDPQDEHNCFNDSSPIIHNSGPTKTKSEILAEGKINFHKI
jgi:hypothetical protein